MSHTNEVTPGYDNEIFEQDLQEILESTPPLNNCSETVQSGLSRVDTGPAQDITQSDVYSSTRPTTLPPVSAAPVTTDVTLSTPHNNGDFIPKSSATNTSPNTKLEVIKAWGVSTYKCTTQYLKERFGKATRTVDLELDLQIEVLRDTQKKYTNILRLARTLVSHFGHVVQTQRALADSFGELSQKCEELQDEFSYNTQTQRTLVKNGENLLGALNFFTSSVNTLVNKTMEDTVLTIRQYETARLEYDAYKSDLDSLTFNPNDNAPPHKIADAKQKYEEQKNKYERLRNDVAIKLKFLEENKVKVMHKQLLLFHNAMSAYFSGNETALHATLQQFNIKLTSPNATTPSWLEN